ncbi:digestive organ expansion factor homolog [Diachasma alloeum]|uniref:digestive organ expansion factor homolog n=1 Tax=Diachasma alloeum TaxID=454923 RepID=UPI0007382EFF|nr:digestive organ expansion factor homolog [Diachasma alloeum]
MARGKRPIRGGKQAHRNSKFQKPKPKQKKGKFNLREASYVKDRDAKNAEIENRRRILAEQETKKRRHEYESSEEEEEEDSMRTLLSTFSNSSQKKSRIAIESESESEEQDDDDDEHEQIIDEGIEEELNSEAENSSDVEIKNEKIQQEVEDAGKSENEGGNGDEDAIIEIQTKEEDEEDEETSREDQGIIKDPFSLHLNHDLSDELHEILSSQTAPESQTITWPILGRLVSQIPKIPNYPSKSKTSKILEAKHFAIPGSIPSIISKIDWTKLYIKSQIQNNLTRANYLNIKDNLDSNPSALTPLQKELFSIINNYQDLMYPARTFSNENEIRFVYCLHVVNHLLKTRTKILHHNAKLSKSNKSSMGEVPDEYRDQGLVRPKILIIVPFRHSCLKIVEVLISILIGEEKGGSVMNKKRFLEDFGGSEIIMPKNNPKPEDYEQTFRGNTDDTFKIGISVTKKTLKLYSDFYSSDIIISSVLGLRMVVGAEGEEERDYDFLASIELLIMDQTELFFMQNWDHLLHVLDHLHLQPKKPHDTDFSRVRSWCVNGWSKYYRQTLIFSSLQLPEIHAVFNKKCQNYAGKVKVVNPCVPGTVCQVVVQLPQVFHKFKASSYAQAIEGRMEFFLSKILPEYKDSIMNHTMIFVPSYFDFVKLRNYFKKEEMSFVQICEYTKDGKVARARDMFFHSDANFLIYSERFHFFRRIRVKGIRHLIFFAPPTFPRFYSEMCNLMHEANQNPKAGTENNMTVTVLYCKYDAMQLAGIVGTERAGKMIGSDKSVHMLMTGD